MLRCRHARNRRAERGGRPPDFAAMAARCFLREAQILHMQVTGNLPAHHFAVSRKRAMVAMGLEPAAKKARHRGPNPFIECRAEAEKQWRVAASLGLRSPGGPRKPQWEQAIGEQWRRLKMTRLRRARGKYSPDILVF